MKSRSIVFFGLITLTAVIVSAVLIMTLGQDKALSPNKSEISDNTTISTGNVEQNKQLFKSDNQVTRYVSELPDSEPTKNQLNKIASQPIANWLNGDSTLDSEIISNVVNQIEPNEVAQFVLYNIPQRNCSADFGAQTAADYLIWIDALIPKLSQLNQPIVILEPDALSFIDCLNSEIKKTERYSALNQAVTKLSAQTSARIFVDAGHSKWIPSSEIANRLSRLDVSIIDGISLNVSNYQTTADSLRYGQEILKSIDQDLQIIIDTSRNGNGSPSDNQWCNAMGRALGENPKLFNQNSQLYALLWIKVPGESDGSCNSGPTEGSFWLDYALELTN